MEAPSQRITQLLRERKHYGIDTMCFVYHFEGNPAYSTFTRALFSLLETGEIKGTTSVLTLTEVLVKPLQRGDEKAASDYSYILNNFPNLTMRDIDSTISEEAARLKAEYGIRIPDALQVATSITEGAEAFITNDHDLKRIRDHDIILIKDMAIINS